MRLTTLPLLVLLLTTGTMGADTLGFFQQKFSDLHFEQHQWSRSGQPPCFLYTALIDGAMVNVLRIGMGNFVPFKAKKGLTASVCGSVVAFDEGFETAPQTGGRDPKKMP